MTGAEITLLLNKYRTGLQHDTETIGDATTVCAFLLWTFLADAEKHGSGTAASEFQRLADEMPAEVQRMGMHRVKAGHA